MGAGRFRMRDLVEQTGLTRETIHYYLSEGLLPPAIKTGRNTALYTEQHLERLRKIQDCATATFCRSRRSARSWRKAAMPATTSRRRSAS